MVFSSKDWVRFCSYKDDWYNHLSRGTLKAKEKKEVVTRKPWMKIFVGVIRRIMKMAFLWRGHYKSSSIWSIFLYILFIIFRHWDWVHISKNGTITLSQCLYLSFLSLIVSRCVTSMFHHRSLDYHKGCTYSIRPNYILHSMSILHQAHTSFDATNITVALMRSSRLFHWFQANEHINPLDKVNRTVDPSFVDHNNDMLKMWVLKPWRNSMKIQSDFQVTSHWNINWQIPRYENPIGHTTLARFWSILTFTYWTLQNRYFHILWDGQS